MPRWVSGSILLLSLVLLLLWPALVNRGPFLFSDTTTYLRAADAAIFKTIHRSSPWTNELSSRYPYAVAQITDSTPAERASNAPPPPADSKNDSVVLLGRSIYYGALLYISQLGGTFWPAILFQATLTAIAMLLTVERLSAKPLRENPLSTIGILLVPLLSTVGYFVAFLMPDIFAPLGLLAVAHLALFRQEDSRWRRAFWFVLLSAALVFHSANLLLAAILLCGLILLKLLRRGFARKITILPILLALLVGIVSEFAFSIAVRDATGFSPVRPPFLMARLIDDGPGLHYIDAHCPQKPDFTICRYRDRLPHGSDTFLWSADTKAGVFSAVPPTEQRRLAEEENRFALAVLENRPIEVMASAARDFLTQAGMTGLAEFNYSAQFRAGLHKRLPPLLLHDAARTEAFREAMPVRPVEMLVAPLALVSLIFIAVGLWRIRSGSRTTPALFVAIILFGLFSNALICGVLSTPHDRYQSRILWLLPLLAVGFLSRGRCRKAEPPIPAEAGSRRNLVNNPPA